MVCLIASGHVGTLPCTCWALLAAWGLADTPICPGSPKDILFDFFFFPSCELGTEHLQWHEGCAQPGPRNGVGIVAQDLISKCGQGLMYLARNFSSLLLLVHKFTCIPQFCRGQGRELLVLSPTTTFPGTRSTFLVGPFRHFSVPAVEPLH